MAQGKFNWGKLIFGLSATAALVGGVWYFGFRKKEVPPTTGGIIPPSPTPSVDGNKTSGNTTSTSANPIIPQNIPEPQLPVGKPVTRPVYVYSTANSAIVYTANMNPNGSANVGKQIRSTKKGDKVGAFIGNRDIQGYTYLLATDVNNGSKVLIHKSVAKTDF